ncbi:RMD1 family protein [Roseomonas sp. CCTCC AB2023176]|uniref:RMD1 family protein n=1 Tax=Roseomonas sp. CCTCC AB2023176 TaxID=3342640 RepID=UPI0035D94A8D
MAAPIPVVAMLLGERLDTRGLGRRDSSLPGLVVIPAPAGMAFAFRWGAVVTLSLPAEARAELATGLRSRLQGALDRPVEETATLRLDRDRDGLDEDGSIRVPDLDLPRLAIVAETLAKSGLLTHEESELAGTLDRLAPVIAELRRGRLVPSPGVPLRSIGEALSARARAAAQVDTAAKSDLLWEHPELEPLHAALSTEWELEERSEALGRKIAMVREASETLLALIQARRSRGLEIAVVLLIATEVATALFMLARP